MEHLTPAELLRFLEEEANTLQLINAKIGNQLHLLQVEEELFNRKLSKLERKNASTLPIEYGQSEQDANDKVYVEEEVGRREQESSLLIGYDERDFGASPTFRQSPDQETAIESEELQPQATALVESTEQAIEASPMPLLSPGPQNRLGRDGQELSQITALDEGKEMESQQEPQEALRVEATSQPQRTSGRRISRRPARFLD